MALAAVTYGADLEAFMGGLGIGLCVLFFVLLLVGGVGTIRRMMGL